MQENENHADDMQMRQTDKLCRMTSQMSHTKQIHKSNAQLNQMGWVMNGMTSQTRSEIIDTIPTKNGRELVEIRVSELVTNYKTKLAENCCLVCTQHNFCTQQLRYVGITMIVILFG